MGAPFLTLNNRIWIFGVWSSLFFGIGAAIFSIAILLLNSIAVQWICYILLIQISFRIIQHQSETGSFRQVALLEEHVEKLEKLVDEFNHEYYMNIVIWFILNVSLMVHQIFTAVSYIRIGVHSIILFILPTVWCGWSTCFFICNACSNFTSQVKQVSENLCSNVLKMDLSDDEDQIDASSDGIVGIKPITKSILMTKIQFLHSRCQANPWPCQIIPGGYFHLDRRTLTSIAGLMTTYIIILVQFSGNERPGWIKIWNSTSTYYD
ncbi:unnamed protein product [Orchesella dallaii]|uniref:Gustatory receptor n=1 Tax=Orchesella dallaii TaxID=48710 RepID=A0ABP1QH57_9HEXA